MKRIMTLLLAMGWAATVLANGTPTTKGMAIVQTGKGFKVFYRSETSGDVKIRVSDNYGQLVFRETIRAIDHFMRGYSLSSLVPGQYTVTVEGPSGVQTRNLEVARKNPRQKIGLIRMSGDEGRYVLTVANKGEVRLSIRILDSANRLLYAGTENITGDFARIYTLRDVESGFTVGVKSGKNERQFISYPSSSRARTQR